MALAPARLQASLLALMSVTVALLGLLERRAGQLLQALVQGRTLEFLSTPSAQFPVPDLPLTIPAPSLQGSPAGLGQGVGAHVHVFGALVLLLSLPLAAPPYPEGWRCCPTGLERLPLGLWDVVTWVTGVDGGMPPGLPLSL